MSDNTEVKKNTKNIDVKDTPKTKKKVVQKTAKKWKCFECGYKYVSPIPVLAVEHKCKTPPVPNTQRKGMLPDEVADLTK